MHKCPYIHCNANSPPVLPCVPNAVDVAGLNPNALLVVEAEGWPNSEGALPRIAPNPPPAPNPVVPLVAPNAGAADDDAPNPKHDNHRNVLFITYTMGWWE